jgi:hypothetical protein
MFRVIDMLQDGILVRKRGVATEPFLVGASSRRSEGRKGAWKCGGPAANACSAAVSSRD